MEKYENKSKRKENKKENKKKISLYFSFLTQTLYLVDI